MMYNQGGEMKLEENHEIVGNLVSVESDGKFLKLQFSVQKMLVIPSGAIPEQELRKFIDCRIGIFNCSGQFKLRKVNKK